MVKGILHPQNGAPGAMPFFALEEFCGPCLLLSSDVGSRLYFTGHSVVNTEKDVKNECSVVNLQNRWRYFPLKKTQSIAKL